MDKRLIAQALHDQARKDIPDDMNLWNDVQARLGGVPQRAVRSRLTWVVAVILALLAVSVVAYAAARLLQGQPLDPGLQGANEADLVTVLNLKQTMEGQTVTLDYAYADSNRISFSLTATGTTPLDVGYRFGNIELTDDAGHNFTTMFGGGGGGSGAGTPSDTQSYSISDTNSVDASVISGTPDKLNLHLVVPLEEYQLVPTNTIIATETVGSMASDTPVKTMGPFVFDFTIPFIHGQVVDPDQSVTANGLSIHLGRLVIAPSLTRSAVCVTPVDVTGYSAHVSLTVDGKPVSLNNAESLQLLLALEGSPAGCYDFQINQSLYNRPGAWKLSIDSLVSYLTVSHAVSDDGTTVEQSFDGSPDLLAQVRTKLEPALQPYGIELREENGSLKFSYPSKGAPDHAALEAIGNRAIEVETPGPWVFTFKVPPAQ